MYQPMKMTVAKIWKYYQADLHATSNSIGRIRIDHIIIYSWHKVTRIWSVMGFPQISHSIPYWSVKRGKWVGDYCLTPNEQFFSYIMARTSYFLMRWRWWGPLCTHDTNTLSWIFIVLAHWNNSPRVDMSLHSDTLFWFWYQFYSLWFDPTGAQTHDLLTLK